MEESKQCSQCGQALPPDAPRGLCPACLLKVGQASSLSDRQDAGPTAGLDEQTAGVGPDAARASGADSEASEETLPPESPEGLARLFPQLEIVEPLGAGGMGIVYKARQKQLDRLVALKLMRRRFSRDPQFAERFNREARALARLNHPNIVSVYEFGEAGGQFYFIMEYVDGVTLQQMIATKAVAPREALAIVPKLCDALQYAHDEGVVHRDIKPSNILVDKKGRVKIADFGLAKIAGVQEDKLTRTNQGMGTMQYMAPEQMENAKSVDHRADIYSLGVVFYEMLTGELPLGRFAPPSQKVQIDVRLDEVVFKTLEKEPARRYQHVSEVKTQMETIAHTSTPPAPIREAAQEPPTTVAAVAPSEPRPSEPRPSGSGRPAFAALLVLLLLGALGAGGWWWFDGSEAARKSEESVAEARRSLDAVLTAASNAQQNGQWADVLQILEKPLAALGKNDHANKLVATRMVEQAKAELKKRAEFAAGLEKANALLKKGLLDEAKAAFQGAQALWPDAPAAEQAKVAEGIKVCDERARDKRYQAAIQGAQAALAVEKWPEAATQFKQALVEKPGDAVGLKGFAEAHARAEHQLVAAYAKQHGLETAMSIDLGNGVKLDLILIPAGKYLMGSEKVTAAKPVHAVTLSQPFYMGKFLVTQEQWQAIMGSNPSSFKGGNSPVENISWEEAQGFCKKLTEKTGDKVRLPTEAEWEYACRAGSNTDFCFGDSEKELAEYGWYAGNISGTTHAVGEKKPNAWGLYDMHGNVSEWCQDWKDEHYYAYSPNTDPQGPLQGYFRMFRGGSWNVDAASCGSANRLGNTPGTRGSYLGLRVVVGAPQPAPAVVAAYAKAHGLEPTMSLDLGAGVKMEMVLVPAGEFMMGSANDPDAEPPEKPAHKVKISQPFYIGKYDVTVAQFKAFAEAMKFQTEAEKRNSGWKMFGGNQWGEVAGLNWYNPSFKQEDDHPVVFMTWDDTHEFCKWATKLAGRTVRLPTEAEWEYAARGPKSLKYPWGDKWEGIIANVADASLRRAGINQGGINEDDGYPYTSPGGTYKNASWCGAFDMAGNVYQFCQDYFNEKYYGESPALDPQGPAKGVNRVLRGGCWNCGPGSCRSARRMASEPGACFPERGFRVVVAAPTGAAKPETANLKPETPAAGR